MTKSLTDINSSIDIRTCGINLDHWYVVAQSLEVTSEPLEVVVWEQSIVLYRDEQKKIQAIENSCPHRQVKLSSGKIIGNDLECAYHGWRFNSEGKCIFIPYLNDRNKLPNCQITSYLAWESDGFIWVFLGDPKELQRTSGQPLKIPEWGHLNYIATVSIIECQGHFSFLIENLMDMYHGHLHENYQAWNSAKLVKLTSNEKRVDALYEIKSYYKIDKIWSIFQLFFPRLRQLHSDLLQVNYIYPHWMSTLGDDFKIYCLLCPINNNHTRAYLIHFTSLNAFERLHKLPIWFRRWIKNSLFGSAQKMLDGLVKQDIFMIEQEQQAYSNDIRQQAYEINPTISQVQKIIKKQFQLYENN
ncbi:aromatic ring-hydroxylating oxygenase subunit alpha [Cyanobacterium sp. uoEpiScrs1]|uniref:aromatic ring-hydroxylating dioxygenase subunit alpha n=1 Tax=Cyanobacterium sp. uoEpiScrs1 TaxID=2976343 RepID=UPI00226A21B7|nr:aromatic ring-hydroxylating dioxygenase subunit alpha [Cyanobacterium sp. uoEpiScrs1]